ncbi:MAG: hypothetical protein AB7D40_10740 [Bacteroidales bacterium]
MKKRSIIFNVLLAPARKWKECVTHYVRSCVARSRSQMERMCKKTFRFFNVLLAPARKCIASGENSTAGRNARTHGGRYIAIVIRIKTLEGAMRARTEVGGVCFYVHGASVRALCGDKVALRWPCQLHCARRYTHKQPAV